MKEDVTLARWLNDEMDEQELKEFMASPGFETYRRIKEYSAQLQAPAYDAEPLYDKILRNRTKETKVRSLNPWIGRIAAVLFVALGAAFYLYTIHVSKEFSGFGQTASFILPDNSSVTLNAGSEASFKEWNWSNNRKMTLNGEAYFKAAKGKTFDVVTPQGTVTVVGTQFNVKSRGNRLDVTCYEGKVRVTCNGNTVLLTPGESIACEDGILKNLPETKLQQPGWTTGETEFTAETLAHITAELERQYNITIKLTAERNKRFTGTIPTNDLDNAIKILEIAYNLRTEKQGNTIILTGE